MGMYIIGEWFFKRILRGISNLGRWLFRYWAMESIIERAIIKNDVAAIEACLQGRYRGWLPFIRYRRIGLNEKLTFGSRKMTMLHMAAKVGSAPVVHYLLGQQGIDCTAECEGESLTPFQMAIKHGQISCIKEFTQSDVLPVQQADLAVHFAATCKEAHIDDTIYELLNALAEREKRCWGLIDSGSDSLTRMQLALKNEEGDLALHVAARCGNVRAIRVIIESM